MVPSICHHLNSTWKKNIVCEISDFACYSSYYYICYKDYIKRSSSFSLPCLPLSLWLSSSGHKIAAFFYQLPTSTFQAEQRRTFTYFSVARLVAYDHLWLWRRLRIWVFCLMTSTVEKCSVEHVGTILSSSISSQEPQKPCLSALRGSVWV
jgi:hypothetical protein